MILYIQHPASNPSIITKGKDLEGHISVEPQQTTQIAQHNSYKPPITVIYFPQTTYSTSKQIVKRTSSATTLGQTRKFRLLLVIALD